MKANEIIRKLQDQLKQEGAYSTDRTTVRSKSRAIITTKYKSSDLNSILRETYYCVQPVDCSTTPIYKLL